MLDGRVLEASQVEYKPFGKHPLKREGGVSFFFSMVRQRAREEFRIFFSRSAQRAREGFRFSMVRPTGLRGRGRLFFNGSPNGSAG